MADIVFLGSSDDFFQVLEPAVMLGFAGADTLTGSSGGDDLWGGDGDDLLDGQLGDDILLGETGRNTVTGGGGSDVFGLERSPNNADGNGNSAAAIVFQDIVDFERGTDRLGLALGLAFADLRLVLASDLEQDDELIDILDPPSSEDANAPTLPPIDDDTPATLIFVGDSDIPIARIRNIRPDDLSENDFATAEVLEFGAATFRVNEDGTPVIAVTVTRDFSFVDPINESVGATIALLSDTANVGEDTTVFSVPVSFRLGERSQTVEIPIVDDRLVEGTERLELQLRDPSGGASLGDRDRAELFIDDNDPAPEIIPGTLQFATDTLLVDEDAGFVDVTVTRTEGSSGPVSAQVQVTGGSATPGADFVPLTTAETVTWAAGDTAAKTVRLTVLDDADTEPVETVSLALSNPTGGAGLGEPAAVNVLILDNDAPAGVLQFANPTYTVNEAEQVLTIAVTRTAGSAGAVSAEIVLSDGTATAGSDFVTIPDPIVVNFADGDTATKIIQFPIFDDAVGELDETYSLTLRNATGGAALGSQQSATVTIVDDDVAIATLNFDNAGDLQPVAPDPLTGISFSGNALTIADFASGGSGNFVDLAQATGTRSAALTYDRDANGSTTMVMNVPSGFRDRLAFRYAAPFELDRNQDPDGDGRHEVTLYSGPNGTGTILAIVDLPATADTQAAVGAYGIEARPLVIPFAGVAQSVAFGSQPDKLLIDDIAIGSVTTI
jgi:hypothetical protein